MSNVPKDQVRWTLRMVIELGVMEVTDGADTDWDVGMKVWGERVPQRPGVGRSEKKVVLSMKNCFRVFFYRVAEKQNNSWRQVWSEGSSFRWGLYGACQYTSGNDLVRGENWWCRKSGRAKSGCYLMPSRGTGDVHPLSGHAALFIR